MKACLKNDGLKESESNEVLTSLPSSVDLEVSDDEPLSLFAIAPVKLPLMLLIELMVSSAKTFGPL